MLNKDEFFDHNKRVYVQFKARLGEAHWEYNCIVIAPYIDKAVLIARRQLEQLEIVNNWPKVLWLLTSTKFHD